MASDLNARLAAILDRHPKEEWRTIKRFPSYEVSDLGRVRSNKTYRGTGQRLIKSHPNTNGYPAITFYENRGEKGQRVTVHRIVAETFLGAQPFPKAQVNHVDCDKLNCKLTNLEWVTASENIQHAYDNGRRPLFRYGPHIKMSEKIVRVMRSAYRLGTSTPEISDWLGIHRSTAAHALVGNGWTHAGGVGLTSPIENIRTRWDQVRMDNALISFYEGKDTP